MEYDQEEPLVETPVRRKQQVQSRTREQISEIQDGKEGTK
jgi:hypothetical protein